MLATVRDSVVLASDSNTTNRVRDIETGWYEVGDGSSTNFGVHSAGLSCELAELDGWLARCTFDWLDCKLAEQAGWLAGS